MAGLSLESGRLRAKKRISPEALAEESLKQVMLGGHAAGSRITERWIVDRFAVTHAQAREALHHLEKRGALTLTPRRGARLIELEEASPAEMRPVWLALIELAVRLAVERDAVPEPAPEAVPDDRWGRYKAVESALTALGEASGNARLTQALQRLAVEAAASQPADSAIQSEALTTLIAELAARRVRSAEKLIPRTFAVSPRRPDARAVADQALRGVFSVPAVEESRLAPGIRKYFEGLATRIGHPLDRAPAAAQHLAAEIRQQIQFGEIRPGDAIREQPLAEAFGVSRGPVRDALRLLDRHGLISLQGRRGAFVKRFSAKGAIDIGQVRAALSGVQMAEAARVPVKPDWIEPELRAGIALLRDIAEDPDCPVSNYILVRRAVAIVTLAAGGNTVVGRLATELESEVTTLWAMVFSKQRQRKSAETWAEIADAILERDEARARAGGRRIVEEAFTAALQTPEFHTTAIG
ncbi:MAG: GntR family transcriptional regulator [Pseudomonadota bacterium]